MKKVLTPEAFWADYKEYLRKHGCLEAWKSDRVWTKLALHAAEHACESLGYRTQREFLRVDVIGYEGADPDCDWHLRVAYENENSCRWRADILSRDVMMVQIRIV